MYIFLYAIWSYDFSVFSISYPDVPSVRFTITQHKIIPWKKSTFDYSLYSELFPHVKSKKKKKSLRFWHLFCYKVSWDDHTAYSCKEKAQTSILCILATIWYGQNSKRKKKPKQQQTKQKLHKENHPTPPPPRGMKGGKKQSAYQCADFTAG